MGSRKHQQPSLRCHKWHIRSQQSTQICRKNNRKFQKTGQCYLKITHSNRISTGEDLYTSLLRGQQTNISSCRNMMKASLFSRAWSALKCNQNNKQLSTALSVARKVTIYGLTDVKTSYLNQGKELFSYANRTLLWRGFQGVNSGKTFGMSKNHAKILDSRAQTAFFWSSVEMQLETNFVEPSILSCWKCATFKHHPSFWLQSFQFPWAPCQNVHAVHALRLGYPSHRFQSLAFLEGAWASLGTV